MSDGSVAPALSVVIPAYDEQDRIGPFLDEIERWLVDHPDTEVLVVDDGSTDGTVAVVEAYRERCPAVAVLAQPVNRGKGAAVRAGLAHATGAHRVFLDADGSTPIDQVDALLEATGGSSGVVALGSIGVGGALVEQGQLRIRQWAGRLGNRLIQRLAVPGIEDTQRGCKLVSARWCDAVLPLCTVDGWAFDVEMLALSRAAGYELVEVPVRWHHVDGTKVTPGSYPQTLLDVLRVRRRIRALVRAGSIDALGSGMGPGAADE